MQYINDMHQAVTDYFLEYIKLLYISNTALNEKISEQLYSFMDNKYTNINKDNWEKIILVDDFGVGKTEVVF
jgi:hypothetical protein